MTVIVRNDRGKVLARFSRVGRYIDVRGVKQRMTDVEMHKVAVEMVAFAGAGTVESTLGEKVPPSPPPPSGPSCMICDKRFMDGRGLAGHLRTHQDVA